MKILILHSKYRFLGGEDVVFSSELELLSKNNNVRYIQVQNRSGFLGLVQFFSSLFNFYSLFKVLRVVKYFKPNLIIVHNWHFGFGPSIFWVKLFSNASLIHVIHNFRLLCPSATLFYHNKLFLKSLRQYFPTTAIRLGVYRNSYFLTFWLSFIVWFHRTIRTWNNIDKYVFLSEFSADVFKNSGFNLTLDKYFIKPNFVDEGRISSNIEDNFIFVGRLTEEKGIRNLLKLFATLEKNLKIVGDGPLKSLVLDYCDKFSWINYLGSMEHSLVIEKISSSAAMIFPSIWFEGMPLTILEAFSCGTPVIATNLGSMSELVENGVNGYNYDLDGENSLEKVVLKFLLLSDDDKRKLRFQTLEVFQKKYSKEAHLKHFNLLFEDLQLNT